MANPITNTHEPSYEIDPNKLETIEIDLPSPEPVAWIKQGKLGYPVLEFDKPFRYESYAIQNSPIPLYTHPVKEQDESFDRTASHMAGEYVSYKAELTDEEILYFYKPCFYHAEDFVSEIRAILRKAQE